MCEHVWMLLAGMGRKQQVEKHKINEAHNKPKKAFNSQACWYSHLLLLDTTSLAYLMQHSKLKTETRLNSSLNVNIITWGSCSVHGKFACKKLLSRGCISLHDLRFACPRCTAMCKIHAFTVAKQKRSWVFTSNLTCQQSLPKPWSKRPKHAEELQSPFAAKKHILYFELGKEQE